MTDASCLGCVLIPGIVILVPIVYTDSGNRSMTTQCLAHFSSMGEEEYRVNTGKPARLIA